MARTLFRASCPGTLMLMGEHAVLHGKPAVVVSLDKHITVTLTPRSDQAILLHSTLGEFKTSLTALNSLTLQKPFDFILQAILCFKNQLPSGFQLGVESEFSEQMGLGSSAAVTNATLAVLQEYCTGQKVIPNPTFLQMAIQCMQTVQGGVGSGADVAGSLHGGIVCYQKEPPYVIKSLKYLLPLVVYYSGSKKPTPEVIKIVETSREKNPALFEKLFLAIEQCVFDAVSAIETQDYPTLGAVMNTQQGLLVALGVSNALLNNMIDALRIEPGIYGAKISGAGLGDSIIGLGEAATLPSLGLDKLAVQTSTQGLSYA